MIPTTGGFFDAFVSLSGISEAEAKSFRTGTFRYGVFVDSDVPFFLLHFPDTKTEFDAPFNFLKIDDGSRRTWLETEANALHLVLVERRNYIVKGQRFVGLNLEVPTLIKAVSVAQANTYQSAGEVDIAINRTYNRFSIQEMMKASKMYRL